MSQIDVYFGLGSRYSYLAYTQLARIERAHGCRFELQPISSIELMQLRGRSPFQGAPLSGQYEPQYRQRDAEAWAEYYGVPFIEPRSPPEDHRLMARACWAAHRQGAMRRYGMAMFRAIFVEHAFIDPAICLRCAQDLGLDVDFFRSSMDGKDVDEQLTTVTRQAIRRGVFGVPTFFLGDRMFWGSDRLILLERALSQGANR